jgi:uncharacterized repeat protein (TIGR03803 family)
VIGGAAIHNRPKLDLQNRERLLHDKALSPHPHLRGIPHRCDRSGIGPDTGTEHDLHVSELHQRVLASGRACHGRLRRPLRHDALQHELREHPELRHHLQAGAAGGGADGVDLPAPSHLLDTFSPNPDGIAPISPLTNYQNVMYGTASAGGDPNCACGVVFSLTTGGTYTILHTFDPHIAGPPNNS